MLSLRAMCDLVGKRGCKGNLSRFILQVKITWQVCINALLKSVEKHLCVYFENSRRISLRVIFIHSVCYRVLESRRRNVIMHTYHAHNQVYLYLCYLMLNWEERHWLKIHHTSCVCYYFLTKYFWIDICAWSNWCKLNTKCETRISKFVMHLIAQVEF